MLNKRNRCDDFLACVMTCRDDVHYEGISKGVKCCYRAFAEMWENLALFSSRTWWNRNSYTKEAGWSRRQCCPQCDAGEFLFQDLDGSTDVKYVIMIRFLTLRSLVGCATAYGVWSLLELVHPDFGSVVVGFGRASLWLLELPTWIKHPFWCPMVTITYVAYPNASLLHQTPLGGLHRRRH